MNESHSTVVQNPWNSDTVKLYYPWQNVLQEKAPSVWILAFLIILFVYLELKTINNESKM